MYVHIPGHKCVHNQAIKYEGKRLNNPSNFLSRPSPSCLPSFSALVRGWAETRRWLVGAGALLSENLSWGIQQWEASSPWRIPLRKLLVILLLCARFNDRASQKSPAFTQLCPNIFTIFAIDRFTCKNRDIVDSNLWIHFSKFQIHFTI